MICIDCADDQRKDGFSPFQTGAIIDIGRDTYDVWLAVRVPGRRVQLYVTEAPDA